MTTTNVQRFINQLALQAATYMLLPIYLKQFINCWDNYNLKRIL